MSTTGLTGSTVNGVYQISAVNSLSSNGGATSESLLFITSGAVRASSSATVTFTSCNIYLNNVSGTGGNPNAVSLSYNADSTSRADNGRYIRFFDTNIIYGTSGSRRNIFVSELTRSNVIEKDSGSELFVYTQPNAILDTVLIQGVNTVEVVGQFSVSFNLTIDDVTKSYLNWEAGRLDFFGLGILNKPAGASQADAWIGNGASDNASWQWNNKTTFNNQKLYLTAANNRYYDGVTISWEFIDRDTGSAIEDVKVKVKDDFPGADNSGTMAERGEYLTNSSGHIAGTWDSQNRTTVTTGDRNTFFMIRNAVERIDTNGNLTGSKTYPVTVITGDQGNRGENYELDTVLNQVEVKSYLHEARSGFIDGDTFDSTVEIGVLASDLTVDSYSTFILSEDAGITQTTKATVDAYTTLETLDKAYDRIKAEWYDNDSYPLNTFSGVSMDLGATDLIIDGTTTSAYSYTSGDIIISTNTGAKNLTIGSTIKEIITTGDVTVRNTATINGLTITADVTITSAIDLTDVVINGDLRVSTGANSTIDLSNVSVSGSIFNDSASNTLIINSTNGSSLTAGDAGAGNGETNILQTVPIKVTVKDIKSGSLIQGARVFIKADPGGDLPSGDSVTITRVSTTATVSHTAHGMIDGEKIIISGANEDEYVGVKTITYIDANSYSYTVSGSPTTPATGSISAAAQLVNATTDGAGEVNDTHRYTSDQPVSGVVRKATL